ncbi:WhiB family transcriptional regulator [Cryobacterium sp. BB736]|uniref:WhiB family transcriptional regulator n=1 Tax=Cryobacterium sp. BB736 TaxID=2746963 RepID=UPI001876D806|nr:WhiB family transcriptional regulator [Cryobacterium sp. BB736]
MTGYTFTPAPSDPFEDWRADALCAQTDPELFFPEKGGSMRDGKAICNRCHVADRCLAYALETNQEHGLWGGLSAEERDELRKRTA